MISVDQLYPLRLRLVHTQNAKIQIKVFFRLSKNDASNFMTQNQKVPWGKLLEIE